MKKIPATLLAALCATATLAQPIPADSLLEFVREKLPTRPLRLTGTLKVRARNGFTKTTLPVEMDLDWGAVPPHARYRIGDETLDISWNNGIPSYAFSDPQASPTSRIAGTGLTWADLSFSVLWWPNSRLVGEERKINRECFVVDVPVPGTDGDTMRLWIEKKMGMLLEMQARNADGKTTRRLRIKSIKKMDGMWVAKDMELLDKKTENKTLLTISGLKWGDSSAPQTAFDPVEAVNQFAFNLYGRLSKQKEGNLFLSPYSISSALAMVYGGARGETATQMEKTLHFAGQEATHPAFSILRKRLNKIGKEGEVQLLVANSLWPQKGYAFLPGYLSLTKKFYGSEIRPVDYQSDTEGARKEINEWVEKKTEGRIEDLIPEGMLNASIRLVLANAIYFKGNWARQFDAERTHPAPFKLSDGGSVEVQMMSQTASFRIARAEKFQALELPYEGADLSMLILLPNPGEGLPSLGTNTLATLDFRKRETIVKLPRFKVESSFQLGDTLAALGMPLAFSRRADLSGMDGSRNLSIGAVVHKAFVEVNETGTEAAAATAVGVRLTSMPSQFVIDRPFLFVIRENGSGAILFIGRVVRPEDAAPGKSEEG